MPKKSQKSIKKTKKMDKVKIKQEIPSSKKEELISRNEEQYLYVYGIANKQNTKLELKGLKNKPIEKIDFNELSVFTSHYPVLHPLLEENEAMHHAEILKKIANKVTIIPMSFGTVFKEQEILETVLSKSYPALKSTLGLINNKIELGVKVIKKPLEENQLEELPNGLAQGILNSLNKLSARSVKGSLFSERLLLNNSFLVEKNNFSKFSQEIADLEKKHSDLKFIYTGPWPAYSFVNIKIAGG